MRQIVILSVVIALLFAVVVQGKYFGQVCQPNSSFKLACNMCRCNDDGTNMACTRKVCPPNGNNRKPRMCEPGTHFKMDCNDCTCNDDGTNAACTLKACPPF